MKITKITKDNPKAFRKVLEDINHLIITAKAGHRILVKGKNLDLEYQSNGNSGFRIIKYPSKKDLGFKSAIIKTGDAKFAYYSILQYLRYYFIRSTEDVEIQRV